MAAMIAVVLGMLPNISNAETRTYNLEIARKNVTINGITSKKITINGTLPGPVLEFKEGDDAVINVTNHLNEDTSVHWHGLVIPGNMDGAPGFNGAKAIKPHETFTYKFPIVQSGTYWYHSHTLGQEQDGLYAGMIIRPKIEDVIKSDRDYVVLFSDYMPQDAKSVFKKLKSSSDYYQYNRRTVGDFFKDAKNIGLGNATKSAIEWGKMRMLKTDLSDVTGYIFLTNGMTPQQNWTGLFKVGERVRLRFINASGMTMYDVRIPGLKMTVVAADGQAVEPVSVDEFRFGNAETYDVIVEPKEEKAYTIAAESIDRQGFALSTLAPHEGMKGEIPVARPRAELTMSDMNMEMMMKSDSNMDMSHMPPSGWAQTFAPKDAKVLSYSDLKSFDNQPDTREPRRNIVVRLGGNMERYIWTIDGHVFDPKRGFKVGFNERVRLTYINETMMAHPIHLHGMFVQLDNGQSAEKMPNKHTVIVPPGQSLSVILSANNVGEWPFHCHLFFHMEAGMMTKVIVAKEGETLPDITSQPETTMPDMPNHDHNHMNMDKMPQAGLPNEIKPQDTNMIHNHDGHNMHNMDSMEHMDMNMEMPKSQGDNEPKGGNHEH